MGHRKDHQHAHVGDCHRNYTNTAQKPTKGATLRVIPCYSMLYHSGKACLGHAVLLTVMMADGLAYGVRVVRFRVGTRRLWLQFRRKRDASK